ncbi:hypothetical protein [Tenacibaculum xiamenense]|uniref:hypothetical protein n=1 Tax=Tenacibaculum xiamenense TaxID=1261553 RepID=UPI003893D2C0
MKLFPKLLKLALTLLLFLACISDEELNAIQNQPMSFNDLFKKVSSMSFHDSDDTIIYVNYEYDNLNKKVIFLDLEEKEPDFFLLGNPAEVKSRILNNNYEIVYSHDKSESLIRSSNEKDQDQLISSFTEQIENIKKNRFSIAYTPQSRSFYLMK